MGRGKEENMAVPVMFHRLIVWYSTRRANLGTAREANFSTTFTLTQLQMIIQICSMSFP